MSHFDSGSEDGQINDFLIHSGGEHEEGDTDSLDIKPPQAQQRQFSRRKSSKDKKHSREHKHKDRDRARDRGSINFREKMEKERFTDKRHRHMMESTRDSRDIIEIRDRSDRYGYRNRENHDQREYDYNQHRQKTQQRDYNQRMEPPLSNVRDRRKYIEHTNTTDAAERALEDLRSRLLSKRNKYEKENARYNHDLEQRYEQSTVGSDGHSSSNYDQQNHNSRSSSREHRSEAKRKDNIIEVIDSPEQIVDYKIKEKKLISIEDPEQTARRTKLLEAEREMAKRKEVARKELAARRELRKEKDGDDSDSSSLSASGPDRKNTKQKRHHLSEDYMEHHHKKKIKKRNESPVEEGQYEDNRPVEVSDDNENSEYSSGEEDLDYTDDEDTEYTDSGESIASSKHSRKKRRHRKKSEDDIDNIKEVLPGSPLSIGDLSKSPHNKSRNSRSKSRSVRSDLVHSVRSKSRSRSKSTSAERERYLASVSRSRSKSPSPLLEDKRKKTIRERNIHTNNTEGNDIEMKNLDTQEESHVEENTLKNNETSPCDDECEKLPNYYPGIQGCRSVEEFQCLNRIEEGTYGVVYRAKDKRTNEIVALKRLKMEKEKEGFPITSLREINTLLKGQHPNIVTVREIVVGSNMDKIFIVMDYVEHDLKSLMETMKHKEQSFFPGEVKCLTQQLLRAVGHLHDNWILHRDLKTSNLLLSHKGILKVGDFGLAREYGSPLKAYTSLVVTLWYRAPELLLCTKEYSTPIDLWSVGCIFAEFLQMAAMFPGKSEIDQLNRIFKELGTPNEKIWPGYKDLPAVQNSHFTEYPVSNLRRKFYNKTTEIGISLLQGMLTYDPKQRLTAEQALKHPYFNELPLPIDPSMFPTWPAKSELGARKALVSSPKAPSGGSQFKQLGRDEPLATKNPANTNKNTGFVLNAGIEQRQLAMGPGFSLKF